MCRKEDRSRIEAELRGAVENALGKLDQLCSGARSGSERDEIARELSSALHRFNEFLLYGKVPDDLAPLDVCRNSPIVLVVDDEPVVTRFIQWALETGGYTVLTANTSAEALQIARCWNGEIDLVLSDIWMPDMQGPELITRLLEEGLVRHTLLMTGRPVSLPEPVTKTILAKPFRTATLLQRVSLVVPAA